MIGFKIIKNKNPNKEPKVLVIKSVTSKLLDDKHPQKALNNCALSIAKLKRKPLATVFKMLDFFAFKAVLVYIKKLFKTIVTR